MSVRVITSSAEATRDLAARIARVVRAADTLVLAGDLGAGKTTFTQGLAAGLDIAGPVTSPTFTLVHEYAGATPLVHIDVYRLEHLREVHDLGFDELVGGDAVVVVEWGDLLGPLLPAERLDVAFAYGDDVSTRRVTVTPHGPGWSARAAGLRDALAPFEVG